MSRFSFPNFPTLNQEIQLGARTFRWDGTRWRAIPPAVTAVKQEDVNTAVQTSTTALVGQAPVDLDTIEELAAAINNDADFYQTVANALDLKLDASAYTANDILSKLLTVDGPESLLDADTLDGLHASAFLTSLPAHNHDDLYYTETEVNDLLDDKADLVNGKIPAEQLPSYVDDVLEFADLASFPNEDQELGKIYVALDSNKIYRWSGTQYVEISQGAIANDGTLTVQGDTTSITGSGTFTADQATNATITLSHADTSEQQSVNNEGLTFIQDVTLDTYGHVTNLGSATVDLSNYAQMEDVITPNDGILTIAAGTGIAGGGAFTADSGDDVTVTLSHGSTSTETSADNSSNANFIKSLTIDAFGHVTAITSDEVQAGSVSETFTATISSSSWSGTDPVTQTVAVTGLLSTDNPTIDITFANNYNTDVARAIEWSKIYRIATQNDEITVYAVEAPLVDLPIQIKVVR